MSPRLDNGVCSEFDQLLVRLRRALWSGTHGMRLMDRLCVRSTDDDCLCPLAVIARAELPSIPLEQLLAIHNGAAPLPDPPSQGGQEPRPLSDARHAQGLMRDVSDHGDDFWTAAEGASIRHRMRHRLLRVAGLA